LRLRLRNEFARFLLRYKLEAILLLLLSVSASALTLPFPLTLFLGVLILVIGTYTTYKRQVTQESTKSLRDLKRLVEDFEGICFRDGQDSRIVRLLDMVSFVPTGNPFDGTPPKDVLSETEGPAWVARISDVNSIFQLWLVGLKDKVRLLASSNKSLPRYEVFVTIGEFLNLYNNFVEKVAERTIWTASKAYLNDRKVAKATLTVFRENLGHLRDRINNFVKDFNETGTMTVPVEAKALKTDIE